MQTMYRTRLIAVSGLLAAGMIVTGAARKPPVPAAQRTPEVGV